MDSGRKSLILKEGFLVKRGHVVHNWKARWFVMMPDKLLYYKYEGGRRNSCQRGTIPLKDCVITCPFLEYESRPLVFKLQTKLGVDHFMEACSREERDEWAAVITATVNQMQTSTSGDREEKNQQDSAGSQLHNINLSKVLESMYDRHSGIKTSNHVEQGTSYSNCFSGSAVVDWLVFMQLAVSRVEAVTLASALMEEGFLRTVGMRSLEALRTGGEQFMDDSTALYSFSDSLKKRGSVRAETSLSAVEMSGTVIKRGYLLKQGHRRKNWKVRLFVLRSEPAFLHYYDPTTDDVNPVGGFSLRGCLVSSLNDNGVPSGVKGNVQGNLFKIITQSDTHFFIQAPMHQDKMEWIEAIREQT
ncbi:pleckstrin-2 [Gouania willdenowi]|uniref:Pleckstrin-2 n=1 Tax=Gouania willdenowi TaxID=441366 RepID=A0A8C5DE32_GOUWI|nr:pleckstrin-2 [Gouania willdenowi]